MTTRRTVLTATGALGAAALLGRVPGALAQATPTAGDLPEFTLTVTDGDCQVSGPLSTGRYRVTVTNAGTQQSHMSLGWIPETISDDLIAKWQDADPTNDGPTETLFTVEFVGLPDWPEPGTSRTGIVDLAKPGRYLIFDPFNGLMKTIMVDGEATAPVELDADQTFTLMEMMIEAPAGKLAGTGRWQISNTGAFTHEFQILSVGAGTTNEELGAYITWAFSQPEDATPDPVATPPGGGKIDFTTYAPVAAMSLLHPGGIAWMDVDLPAGTYAALCAVPGPTDDIPPHAMLGMYTVLEIV